MLLGDIQLNTRAYVCRYKYAENKDKDQDRFIKKKKMNQNVI
jgi:hypothetical protein